MHKVLDKILGRNKKRVNKVGADFENEAVLKVAQEQLRELARKGLSIPVFTLWGNKKEHHYRKPHASSSNALCVGNRSLGRGDRMPMSYELTLNKKFVK